jgi:hypothetical protein
MLAIAGCAHTGRILEAQALTATLMGGAIWHHVVGEGQAGHSVGCVVFLALAIATAARNGMELPAAAGAGLVLAAVGYGIGSALTRTPLPATASGKQKK